MELVEPIRDRSRVFRKFVCSPKVNKVNQH